MRAFADNRGSLFLLVALAAAYSVYFISSVTLIKYAPAAVVVFLCLLVASIVSVVISGRAVLDRVRLLFYSTGENKDTSGRGDIAYMALAGSALGLSFYLQLAERSSFAPSGSDIVFLLTTTTFFALSVSFLFKKEDVTLGKLVGCVTSLLGVVALVANWEYPSSFAPFVLFPNAEFLVLLSSVALALFMLLDHKLLKTYPSTVLTALVLWIATIVMFAVVIFTGNLSHLREVPFDGWQTFITVGIIGIFLPTLFLNDLLKSVGMAKSSSAFLLLPVIITSMISIEKALGLALMETPFKWGMVAAASIIIAIGVVAVWVGSSRVNGRFQGNTSYFLMFIALAAFALSAVALFFPFKFSTINGTLDSGQPYHSTWYTYVYSSVGGYLSIILALICVVIAFQLLRNRYSLQRALAWSFYCAIIIGAVSLVGHTQLFNWNLSIPAEVQHALGTPYVTLKETPIKNLPAMLGNYLILAFTALVTILNAFEYLRKNKTEQR
jgi:drug/metabolite transporter (DMT)-like permease